MSRFLGYARGNNLGSQVVDLIEYCRVSGLTEEGIYVEFYEEYDQLEKLINNLQYGDVVVIDDPYIISKDAEIYMKFEKEILGKGAKIKFIRKYIGI